ncbi:hypothetical protein [Streptomyces sp. N50]|nr:hypothetical protein [Streptomyces sp. N50]WOX16157.1 hypothetical protein R2B38_45800 [Streptomyces sp. N50]
MRNASAAESDISAAEKRVDSVFAQLGLPPDDTQHSRVLGTAA